MPMGVNRAGLPLKKMPLKYRNLTGYCRLILKKASAGVVDIVLVMKFGGSSLADEQRIRNAAGIVTAAARGDSEPPVVVVSAMGGVTALLLTAADAAAKGDSSYRAAAAELGARHRRAAQALLHDSASIRQIIRRIDDTLRELNDILHGVELVQECSPRTRDLVSGFGERLMCPLLAAHIHDTGVEAEDIDARDIIRTDGAYGRAVVDFTATDSLIRQRLGQRRAVSIVTGFIASGPGGTSTTLGRNGSDYTASIIGAALNARAVEIWTDVDGVLTADPRVVPRAWVIEQINFQEAMELSFFGAEVIHPYTLVPVIEKDLPVYIRNTLNPKAPGTKISSTAPPSTRAVTGIASIDNAAMITIEGGGMVGMPGAASRIFASVASAGINIIMITQSSSEHSISLVCRENEARIVAEALKRDLSDALSSRMIRDIKLIGALEIIAVIGDNMRGRVGLSGKLFSALGDVGVNILAIAQGSTERNISLVIAGKDTQKAIRAIHAAFIETEVIPCGS